MNRWLLLGLITLLAGCSRGGLSFEVDGQTRSYILTVPESLPEDPVPLLLALHQFSDTARGMQRLSGFDAIAAREGFIVCYPQGRYRIWNAGQREDESDVAFLTALVAQLETEYDIDPDRVYATGISAGGMMANYLACRTDILAAIAPVAGTPVRAVLDQCAREHPIPVLSIHGVQDNIVPYAGGDVSTGGGDMSFVSAAEMAAAWARINGCADTAPAAEVLEPLDSNDASRVTRYRYDCPEVVPVVFLSVGGAGHTWPGRDNWYPSFIVGATSMQLDASEAIWAFLSAHRRHAG
ncbi:MAG: prolyl oligopeptidase family serine peptidase [Candidatus Hydrogenedens sp.]|nr:prolyl oligopeptidase family serine peptidase [Candidatus Hydrogenedens sp.]